MFWISKVSRTDLPFFFDVEPGNFAVTVEQYSRKSFFWSPDRAIRVRSYAEETWWGAS